MGIYNKAASGKGKVTNERVGKTHTPMGKTSAGTGANRRDTWVSKSVPGGGSVMRYRSGDVKRTTGSMKKYS